MSLEERVRFGWGGGGGVRTGGTVGKVQQIFKNRALLPFGWSKGAAEVENRPPNTGRRQIDGGEL